MALKYEVTSIALTGARDHRRLKQWAQEVKDDLQNIPGITRVEIIGARDYEIAIVVSEERLREYGLERARQQSFYRFLNRMLFKAARPHERVNVLQRFYRLSDPLIARFYAGETTRTDAMRLLVGKPPVNVWRAMRCLQERSLLRERKAA